MKLSLFDLFGDDEEPEDKLENGATNAPWPIDLVGEVRRGWPLHPADANALFDAFSALGFLRGSPPADSTARDASIISAIGRFQSANAIPPDGSMSRGGRTILHLNKALDPSRCARPQRDLAADAPSPLSAFTERPSLVDRVLRAGSDTRRIPHTGADGSAPTPFALASGSAGTGEAGATPLDQLIRALRNERAPAQEQLAFRVGPFLDYVLPELARPVRPSPPLQRPSPIQRPSPGPVQPGEQQAPPRGQPRSGRPPRNGDPPRDDEDEDHQYCDDRQRRRPTRPDDYERPREILAERLDAAGHPRPFGYHAHHVVAIGRWETRQAIAVLEGCDLSINDCEKRGMAASWVAVAGLG